MTKKIILKTVLICFGIFITISAFAWYYIFNTYKIDTEKDITVLVASKIIDANTVINDSVIGTKIIKESARNSSMVVSKDEIIGSKTLFKITQGDYIRKYTLLDNNLIYKDDDRIVVLPVDINERVANFMKRGSLVDIIVSFKGIRILPQTVLSKIRVDEILDENGSSIGDTIGNKKGYAKFTMDIEQRNKLYVAKDLGSISFDIYCTEIQTKARENFVIPPHYIQSVNPFIPTVPTVVIPNTTVDKEK